MKIVVDRDYRKARAEAYPSLRDFVEAYTEKELGNTEKWTQYMRRIQSVREKFPKGGKKTK